MKFCKEHKGVYPAEICPKCHADLRTRLEKREKELFDARQGMFKQSITIEVLTKNINERNAENAALTEKLEKAHMDVDNAEHNVAENTKQEVMMWIDKCKALERKLEKVREWLKGHSVEKSDYVMGMTSQLRKILDGEGR